MKKAIDSFVALGNRLRTLPNEVIARAVAENPWFTPASIRASVEALRCEMLESEKLTTWLAPYAVPVREPKEVLVIMAGNIPLVGFFDLLCVVVSGHRCLVKPSSKDRTLTEYVVSLLHEIDPDCPVTITDGTAMPDAVIATGSDNTNRYFRERYRTIPALLRGSRFSVAILTGEERGEELLGLEEDIWLHNGLGCRNVSMLWLKRGADFPKIKPQATNEKYRNNYLQTRALLSMTGEKFIDLDGAVAICKEEFPAALSAIAYSYYDTEQEIAAWLEKHDRELQCIVAREEVIRHPRRVDFGRAQHPALTDYPDAVDVIAFLERIA